MIPINKITICGNLTADPILADREWTNKQTGEILKSKVCNFSVAADEGYGERKTTTFFRVHAWRGLAETCAKYLTKGRAVLVVGPVTLNNYVDKNGQMRSSMEIRADEIHFLGGAKNVETPVEQPVELEPEDEDMPY